MGALSAHFKLISRNLNYIPCIDFNIDFDELDLTNSSYTALDASLPFFFLVTLRFLTFLTINFFLSFSHCFLLLLLLFYHNNTHALTTNDDEVENESENTHRENGRGQFMSDGPDRSWRNIQDGKV